jgi:hypothetical protein
MSSNFKINLGDNSLLEDFKEEAFKGLGYKDLKLSFDGQFLRIFWQNRKIISNLLLNFFDGKNWFSSYNFEKFFFKKENNSVQVLFRSLDGNLKFVVDISLEENLIDIDVKRITSQDLKILIEGIDFLVTPKYKKYFLQDRNGEFINEFSELPYDHLQGSSISNQVLFSSESKKIPMLFFKKDDYSQLVQLSNSDYRDCCRIVTFNKSYPEKTLQSSGTKNIFKIKIFLLKKEVKPIEIIKPFMIKNNNLKIEFKDNFWIPSYQNIIFTKTILFSQNR